MDNLYAVILAAGKGRRMDSTDKNKVTLKVAGKPMIIHTINTLKSSGIKNIIVVVGFAKESVTSLLPEYIKTVEQVEQLGTGDATKAALNKIPEDAKNVLVLYGDDSYIYTPKHFQMLLNIHQQSSAAVTFFTKDLENPATLGRVLREDGKVIGVVEEKNASKEQKKIKEVNLGGFLFNAQFLSENINKLSQNEVSGEYYITDIIDLAAKQGLAVRALKLENLKWRGVNTPEELKEAEISYE